MKILDRYIFRETLTPALIALSALTFVFFSQQLGRLLESLVRQSATVGEFAELSLAIIPNVLTFTIPMAVLVGILTGFGRMSSDSESIAFRAAGVSMKRLLRPVLALAFVAWAVNIALAVWIAPQTAAYSRKLALALAIKQVSLELRPRVFNENISNIVLYVQNVAPNGREWHGIMLADMSDPEESRVTFAKSGTLAENEADRTLELTLTDGHVLSPLTPSRYYTLSDFDANTFSVPMPEAQLSAQRPTPAEWNTADLWERWRQGALTAQERIEFQRRVALPFACFAFALIGLPLGVSTTRGSKSMGLVVSLMLMLLYYLIFPFFGTWVGNILFAAIGIIMLLRSDREGENAMLAALSSAIDWLSAKLLRVGRFVKPRTGPPAVSRRSPHPKFFRLLDIYVLRGFWYFFVLVLVVFVSLFIVITLFQLLPDIVKNNIGTGIVATYFFFLLPHVLYWVVPLTVLLAILINLGTLTKTNEILAVKAGAISLYRISLPLLFTALFLSVGVYALQEFVLPRADRRQDEYHNVIKGRAPQTYRDPERKWMAGSQDRIYHYNYFDPARNLFGEFSLFEFEPNTWQLKRWIFASRAVWTGFQWTLQDGWVRGIRSAEPNAYSSFQQMPFAEIDPPDYFKKEVRMADQMTYGELKRYVEDLRQSGFEVSALTVDLHRKLSFPLVSFIMAIIGIPFSFKTGKRGAFYGIGLCVAVGIFYWATFELFDKLGGINRLSPLVAAWFPNLIFGVGGIWMMLRVKT
jgi:LPS export ABC transporter permease LptF/LPS export ABC transporter permease LptG